MNNELESILKNSCGIINLQFWNLTLGTEENHEISVTIAGLRDDIWTQNLFEKQS